MELNYAQYILDQLISGRTATLIKKAKGGLINETYFLETTNESYVLQKINESIFKNYNKGLENILTVKNWLVSTDFPYHFPTPIGDKYLEEYCLDEFGYLYVNESLIFLRHGSM